MTKGKRKGPDCFWLWREKEFSVDGREALGESREDMTVSHVRRGEGQEREEPGASARRLKGNGAVKMVGLYREGQRSPLAGEVQGRGQDVPARRIL